MTPAHNHLDYLLSKDLNIPVNGVVSAQTGLLQLGSDYDGLKIDDPKILKEFRNSESFISTYRQETQAFRTVNDHKRVLLLTLNGWQMTVDDKLKFECFKRLGKVRCVPPLNTKTTE